MSEPGANQEFQNQVKRLMANYGEDKFNKDKINLIWEELKDFYPKQIKRIFDRVLEINNFAPTIQPFREFASQTRELVRQWEREQERQRAKDFWEGTLHSDEVKSIIQTMGLRIQRKISDDEYKQFQDILKTMSDRNPPKCKKCDDTGVYYDESMRPYKCQHLPQPIMR